MGLLRKVAYAFLGLFLAFIIMFVAAAIYVTTHQAQPQPGPVKVTDQPAGLAYGGPQTTAIAGWYCVEELNSTPLPGPYGEPIPVGYGVQLNALLSNGDWVQDVMGPVQCGGACPSNYVWAYWAQFWFGNTTTANSVSLPGPVECGWLVIAVWNGTAYTGYSTDGKSVTWYASYPVGNATIMPNTETQLVIGGPGFGEGINVTKALIYFAMYYWDGTSWEPAPVASLSQALGAGEWVSQSWVYTGGRACGVVSWPEPVNTTQCPLPPSFSPTPSPT